MKIYTPMIDFTLEGCMAPYWVFLRRAHMYVYLYWVTYVVWLIYRYRYTFNQSDTKKKNLVAPNSSATKFIK